MGSEVDEENEQDPGFPSGPWNGFYTYWVPGFHHQSLNLTFRRGRMTGNGQDDIGHFAIAGGYDTETRQCWWNKTYVGAHTVYYRGAQTGRTIQGEWQISAYHRGSFSIWPGGEGGLDGEFFIQQAEPVKAVAPEVGSPALKS